MLPILHNTTKFDGGIHYRFPARIAFLSKTTLVVYRGPGVLVESYRGIITATRHMLGFYHSDRHHNTLISWHGDWSPHMHYVNICTPATWDEEMVTCVDMDLDILRMAGEDHVFIDDEDEFESHTTRFGYPDDLVAICRQELTRVQAAMVERQGVFSDVIYQWRPGDRFDRELIRPV